MNVRWTPAELCSSLRSDARFVRDVEEMLNRTVSLNHLFAAFAEAW